LFAIVPSLGAYVLRQDGPMIGDRRRDTVTPYRA